MDQQLRLQRIEEMRSQQLSVAITMMEQAIAMSIYNGWQDEAEKAWKSFSQFPVDHPWRERMPSKEEIDVWLQEKAKELEAKINQPLSQEQIDRYMGMCGDGKK